MRVLSIKLSRLLIISQTAKRKSATLFRDEDGTGILMVWAMGREGRALG